MELKGTYGAGAVCMKEAGRVGVGVRWVGRHPVVIEGFKQVRDVVRCTWLGPREAEWPVQGHTDSWRGV